MAVNKKNLNIILLGDPSSGKATQVQWLQKKYHLYDLDMGSELRKMRLESPRYDRIFKSTIDLGHLAPTAVVREILRRAIVAVPKSKGIVFDGTPKMVAEAKLVHKILEQQGRKKNVVLVLYMTIPFGEMKRRTQARIERIKGSSFRRPDDSIKGLENRLKYYRTEVTATVKYFRSKYFFRKISGLDTRAEVSQRINKAISEFWRLDNQDNQNG